MVIILQLTSCGTQPVDYSLLSYDETMEIACNYINGAYLDSNPKSEDLMEAEKAFRVLAASDSQFEDLANELKDAYESDSDFSSVVTYCGKWRYHYDQTNPSDLESPEAKADIDLAVNSFFAQNCIPYYWTYKDSDFKLKRMSPYHSEYWKIGGLDPELNTKEWMYLDTSEENSYYGNFATRTIFLTSIYEYHLSEVYSNVFDVHKSELKGYVKTYNSFLRIASHSAKSICQLSKENLNRSDLTEQELEKVRKESKQLISNWNTFKSWIEEVESQVRGIEAQTG